MKPLYRIKGTPATMIFESRKTAVREALRVEDVEWVPDEALPYAHALLLAQSAVAASDCTFEVCQGCGLMRQWGRGCQRCRDWTVTMCDGTVYDVLAQDVFKAEMNACQLHAAPQMSGRCMDVATVRCKPN
jgi:hypothetical protein